MRVAYVSDIMCILCPHFEYS